MATKDHAVVVERMDHALEVCVRLGVTPYDIAVSDGAGPAYVGAYWMTEKEFRDEFSLFDLKVSTKEEGNEVIVFLEAEVDGVVFRTNKRYPKGKVVNDSTTEQEDDVDYGRLARKGLA